MGYRPFAVPSPYLWSFSNVYAMGKYVATAVSIPMPYPSSAAQR
jgi:Uncharacterized conserved protein